MFPTYSVSSICPRPAVYTAVFCGSVLSAWSVTRGRRCWMLLRGCSHTLSSPGIAKRTLEYMNKGTKVLVSFFFSSLPSACWLLSCPEPPGASGEPCSAVGKPPHFFMSPSRSKIPNYRPASVCFFVIVNKRDKLPMINNIALTSTPALPLDSAAKFNSISCVCRDFGCFSPRC